jgi:hypothetical protein
LRVESFIEILLGSLVMLEGLASAFSIETGIIKISIANSTIYTGYNSAIGNNQ